MKPASGQVFLFILPFQLRVCMQQQKLSFTINIYEDLSELSPEDRDLLSKAVASKAKAYAPYSNFRVGAAVRLKDGTVILGNNQENVSYPSGLCAERVAVFHAKALHPEIPITTIAISSSSEENPIHKPAAPCGNCRQAISEYEQQQASPIRILLRGIDGPIYECVSMSDLLPLSFDNSYLNSK